MAPSASPASVDETLTLLRSLTEAGALTAVEEVVHVDLPNEAEAFVFRFERATISVVVNPDDDSLSVRDGVPALAEGQSQRPSSRGGAWVELYPC